VHVRVDGPALVVAVLATLVLGLLPAFRVMLYFHLIADVLLVAYVALLIHQRNVAAERDMKVRFLPQPHRLDPALLRAEPALLRRSAN
jgi:type III secretory pathway component EscV